MIPSATLPTRPAPAAVRNTARLAREGFVFWGLYFCLLIQHLQVGKQIPALEVIRPFMLSMIVVAGAWLFEALGQGRGRLVLGRQTWTFLAFLAVTAASVPVAFNTGRAYDAFIVMLKFFIVYFIIINVVDTVAKLQKVIYVVIATVAYMAARGVVAAVRQPSSRGAVGAVFFLGDSNDFAMVLTMMLPFTYFLLPTCRTLLAKAALVGAGLSFVLATIFTSSRGGTIALLAVLLYCVLSSRRRTLAVGLTALLMAVATMAAPASYWERMSTIWEARETDTSARIRLEAWKAAVRMGVDYPILGVGAANFAYAKGMVYRTEGMPGENWNWVGPHSIYFGTLGELGFTGLAILMLLMLNMLLACRQTRRLLGDTQRSFLAATSKGLEGSLLAFAVAGTFIGNTYHPLPWNTAAFIVVTLNLAQQASARQAT